jgi:two-component system alkaline phosphatase synthesis response regulator PhoP
MSRPMPAAAAKARGRVLVVDDDELFVGCSQALLEGAGYLTLTAATGEEALRIAREHAPPVVLLDIQLPKLNGYEVCRTLRDEFGRALAIAFVSGSRMDTVDISLGLLVGADDYLVKPCDPSELVARVGALMRRVRPEKTRSQGLTSREVEVLRLLSDGLNQRDIAQTLSISPKTVAIHIEHIIGKLNVHSRAQAVAAAYRENLFGSSPYPVTF